MATLGELIAANMTVDEICSYIGADSLGYLDVPGLMRAMDTADDNYCKGCFHRRIPDSRCNLRWTRCNSARPSRSRLRDSRCFTLDL